MGGNALAPFGARRHDRAEYERKRNEVLQHLYDTVPGCKPREIPAYKAKESFGDLDILVQGPLTGPNYDDISALFESINTAFSKPSAEVRNGGVMSVLYKELQVDIIPMPEEDYWTAYHYYSYNDMGNLIGKIYHKFGLKYGHRGLTMPMKDGDNQYEEVIVSKNTESILAFLGLGYWPHCMGVNTLEEVFTYVCSSKYFTPLPFQYENLNHTNRIRDRKRATYHAFLEYIEGMEPNFVFDENKEVYLPLIFDHFPGVKDKYDEGLKKLEHRLKVKEHFNGKLVAEWIYSEGGEELGKFMGYLKAQHGPFSDWVMRYNQQTLREMVEFEWKIFSTQYFKEKHAK